MAPLRRERRGFVVTAIVVGREYRGQEWNSRAHQLLYLADLI